MSTESGFSNQKKYGEAQFKTIHNLGSNRYGTAVTTKALSELYVTPKAITDVHVDANGKDAFIEVIAHGARRYDVLRFMSGTLIGYEVEVIKVIDANTLQILNVYTPQIGDTVKPMRWVTSKADAEGNLSFSPGPTQFVRNGVNATVTQDSATPANNRALPSLMTVYKDGTEYPVTKDTATPGNTVAIPVEIVSASGTTVTINAGDINVQTSHTGANYDSMRLGNGTNLLNVNADGSINTVTTITGAATETTLAAQAPLFGAVNETAPATDTASSGLNGRLQRIAQRLSSLIALLPSVKGQNAKADFLSVTLASDQGALAVTMAAVPTGAALDSSITAQSVLIGAVTETAPATDVASSGLNGRLQRIAQRLSSILAILPSVKGQNAKADSLSVTLASDQGTLAVSMAAVPTGAALDTTVAANTTALNSGLGALTETAPVTDTASSGLNGRLQRIAQRLSSLIGLLPASLGAKTSAASLSVVLASDQVALAQTAKVASYQEIVNLTTTAQTFTAPAGAKWMKIQADLDNPGTIRMKLGGTASVSSGLRLEPARSEDFEVAGDISVIAESGTGNKVYVIFGV